MQKIFYSYYMKFNEIVCLFFRRIHRREDHSWMVTNSSNLIDCEHESVEENPKMLAFFDSLVQRDLRYYPYMRYHILGFIYSCAFFTPHFEVHFFVIRTSFFFRKFCPYVWLVLKSRL